MAFWKRAEDAINDWEGTPGSRVGVIRQGDLTRRFLAEPNYDGDPRKPGDGEITYYNLYERDPRNGQWGLWEGVGYPETLREAEKIIRYYAKTTETGYRDEVRRHRAHGRRNPAGRPKGTVEWEDRMGRNDFRTRRSGTFYLGKKRLHWLDRKNDYWLSVPWGFVSGTTNAKAGRDDYFIDGEEAQPSLELTDVRDADDFYHYADLGRME